MDYMEELKKSKVVEYCNEHLFERVLLYDYDHASNEYWVEFLHHPQRYHRKVGREKLRPIPDPEPGLVFQRYNIVDVERERGFYTGTVVSLDQDIEGNIQVLQFLGNEREKEWVPAASVRREAWKVFEA